MAEIFESVDALVGRTPLLRLAKLEKKEKLRAVMLAKLEYFNPAGSIKDRVARAMLNAAEKDGRLKAGGTIIEPTSGNTGIGLAAMAAARGCKLVVTMPENMSRERKLLIEAYGAKVVLTPAAEGMKGAIAKAKQLEAEIPDSIIAGQFDNPANPQAHREGTGPEIWSDTDGKVDIFVAGVGTGGCITGVGEYLKAVKPEVRIVAVEPAGSPVLSDGTAGPHKIQGIGAGFVPPLLNRDIVDEVVAVSDEAAFAAARLAAKEGTLCGISSGANLYAAMELGRRPENAGKVIVTLFPDSGDRYLSTELYVV